MNAVALTASRPLIRAVDQDAASPPNALGQDSSEFWPAAEKLFWSLLCFCGLAVLLVGAGVVALGTLAMIATILGGREEAWWPAMTCGVLLYLFAKGSISCWDAARAALGSWIRLRRS
jgi:hypothetical protein